MTIHATILTNHAGEIFGARIYAEHGSGHTLLMKRRYSVLRVVEASTWHPTNGERGRAFKSLDLEEQEQAFTTLLLRAMSAPMDEPVLFADIAGTW